MFTLKNSGKCLLYSKCGCVPGTRMDQIFRSLFLVESSGSQSAWDFLKDKLGLQRKKIYRGGQIDSRYLEPEAIPVQSNSPDEMWKPGYRGRTENKRH